MEAPFCALLNRRRSSGSCADFALCQNPSSSFTLLPPSSFLRSSGFTFYSLFPLRIRQNDNVFFRVECEVESLSKVCCQVLCDFLTNQQNKLFFTESFCPTISVFSGQVHCIFGPRKAAMILNQDPANYHILCAQQPHYPICNGGSSNQSQSRQCSAVTVLSLCSRPHDFLS